MSEGFKKLKAGVFNNMSQERQPDGSVVVTLTGRRYAEAYKFRVKDLYGPDEQELNIETGDPVAPGT